MSGYYRNGLVADLQVGATLLQKTNVARGPGMQMWLMQNRTSGVVSGAVLEIACICEHRGKTQGLLMGSQSVRVKCHNG